MLLKVNHGAVSYGAEAVLTNINFEINAKQKIAVVGRNGCGKTTLLKLLSGEVELDKRDSDEDIYIAKSGSPVIGYLKQIAFADESVSLETEVRKVFEPYREMQRNLEEARQRMEADPSELNVRIYLQMQESFTDIGGYYYEKEYETMLRKFGFTEADKKKPLAEFSGGQQTKIGFIKLLLTKPDILLLDEPTNHLDVETIEWLEAYLKAYERAVVIVSHDRLFLDRIVDTVYEIEYGISHRYVGNYSSFVEQKKAAWDKQEKDYIAQQKEIARLMELVERFKGKPTKVSMARSKLKQIEHMEKIAPPQRYDLKAFHANFQPDVETGKEVLRVQNLQIGYDKPLCEVNLLAERQAKIGIVGGNGLGKSTFLKTIMGMVEPLSGEYQYGIRVKIGYFDQQMAHYSSDKTVLDDYWEMYPNLTQTEVRTALGAFLFSGDDVFKQVSMLSGGERVRLALCKILKMKPNVLILDEPTNHMDIVGKEALEQMLSGYSGTLIFVSHDRYFVRQVANQILSFDGASTSFYRFGYEEYEEKAHLRGSDLDFKTTGANAGKYGAVSASAKYTLERDSKTVSPGEGQPSLTAGPAPAGQAKNASLSGGLDRRILQNPGKERSRLMTRLSRAEAAVEESEAEIAALQEKLEDPAIATSYAKLGELQAQIAEAQARQEELMSAWEEAQGALEEFEAMLR